MNQINSLEDREALKNKAVETREAGKLTEAKGLLQEVIKWDEENNNFQGEMDALGHLKLTLRAEANEAQDETTRQQLLKEASDATWKAVEIGQSHPEIPEGPAIIQKIHLVNLIIDQFANSELPEKTTELKKALIIINEAIEKLPGTKAHKAWPLNAKAQILLGLDKVEEALDTLELAERNLYEGYEDELKKDDQAELKLNVWLAGLHLTKAKIYQQQDRQILAHHYANSVLNIDDPKNMLGLRKSQAKKILEEIS